MNWKQAIVCVIISIAIIILAMALHEETHTAIGKLDGCNKTSIRFDGIIPHAWCDDAGYSKSGAAVFSEMLAEIVGYASFGIIFALLGCAVIIRWRDEE
jgi:hypothetical protein